MKRIKTFVFVTRLNKDIKGGAWCPRNQITTETIEWLEVDLHSVHVVSAVGTQGRFGNGQGQEFAENYVLEYWRPKLSKWMRYRGADDQEVSFYARLETGVLISLRPCVCGLVSPKRMRF